MDLPNNYENKFGTYDLINQDYELNTTLNNLIIFLKYIVRDYIVRDDESILKNDINFFDTFIKDINREYKFCILKKKYK